MEETYGDTGAWPELKTQTMRQYCAASGAANIGCSQKVLRFTIARLRRGSRGREQISGERALHIAGAALVEDRGRDRPQADFTVLIPTHRIGLLVRPELVSIH